MASSSYCDLIITLKNGEEISWIGEDGFSPFFQVPDDAKKCLVSIKSKEDLFDFILKCASVYEDFDAAKEMYYEYCADFDKSLKKIKNIDDVKLFSLAWGEYDPEDGFPVEEVATGESIEFDFETKKGKKKSSPSKEFVREMNEIYGDLFDEEY